MQFASVWFLRDDPVPENILPPGFPLNAGEQLLDLEKPIEGFHLHLPFPKYATTYATREFFGGTVFNMLKLIYNFYQEPVTVAELRGIAETTFDPDERYMLQQKYNILLRGGVIKRLELDYTDSAAFGGIQQGVLQIIM